MSLPAGYSTDTSVGFAMLVASMERHGLTSVGVQNHGQQIVDALNADYPGLGVYLSSTDSPVWPGFGSLDVTIDSGLGGWEFRPDGYFAYDPSKAPAPTQTPVPVPTPVPLPGLPPLPVPAPAADAVLEALTRIETKVDALKAQNTANTAKLTKQIAAVKKGK